MNLFNVDSLEECQNKINYCILNYNLTLGYEEINLLDSNGRILFEDIYSKEDSPNFNKSTVDGFAVIANDTNGASETVPSFLKIVGETQMGEEQTIELKNGECVYVPTGGMLPKNSNAVIMIEYTENLTDDQIAIYNPIAEGQNVIKIADDINENELLIKKGTIINSGVITTLCSVGITKIKVFRKLNTVIISTGNELEKFNKDKLQIGKIRDSNSIMLKSICDELNINVLNTYILKDDYDLIYNTINDNIEKVDIIIISGGSSKGKKDFSEKAIEKFSTDGILTHGISIKPGKPTITGFNKENKTILLGLPGHPIACNLIFRLLISNIIKNLTNAVLNYKTCIGKITENIKASPGKTTIQLVDIDEENNIIPILGRSGIVKNISKAKGYIIIELNNEGINKNDLVKMYYL